eukprot:scaffold2675_cov398-Prasinococcus_capsulatus_cf.AAC.9
MVIAAPKDNYSRTCRATSDCGRPSATRAQLRHDSRDGEGCVVATTATAEALLQPGLTIHIRVGQGT